MALAWANPPGSCTTNCLAAVVKVRSDKWGGEWSYAREYLEMIQVVVKKQ